MSISMLIVLFVLSTIFEVISIIAVLMVLKGKIDVLSTKIEEIYSSMRSAQGFIQCELSKIHGTVIGHECMLKKITESIDLSERYHKRAVENRQLIYIKLEDVSRMLESVAFAVDLIGSEIRKKNEGENEVESGGSDEKSPENSPEKNDAQRHFYC